jgi:6-phosphogluconate dehydrogenase
MANNGFDVAVHNRTTSRMTDFVEGDAAEATVTGHEDLNDFVDALSSPRIVMLMVKAGRAVDAVLDAVADLRATGVRSILVTGRILGELRHGLQTRPPPRTKENTSNG